MNDRADHRVSIPLLASMLSPALIGALNCYVQAEQNGSGAPDVPLSARLSLLRHDLLTPEMHPTKGYAIRHRVTDRGREVHRFLTGETGAQ